MNEKSTQKFLLPFLLLVFFISTPFWLIGIFFERFLPEEISINLPVSALMFVCPALAALILVYKENGPEGVKQLMKRSFDAKGIKRKWYLPIFLLMPVIFALEYGWMKLTGMAVPDFQTPIVMAPVFFVMFFISALGEEIGWSGYVTDPLQARWGALGAGIILGTVWAIWHVVPFLQGHNPPMWIVWQCAFTIANRVLIIWLYNNTGKSVPAAILFHAIYDVCWSLYPNYGSSYDPFLTFVLTAVAATMVTIIWGPRTLAG